MDNESPETVRSLKQRVLNLEELFAHEERKVQQLNHVVVELRRELDSLNTQISQLQARFRWVLDNSGSGEDLPHEKPPHY